jgi:transcriptional regulator with XRE-family HTH domain
MAGAGLPRTFADKLNHLFATVHRSNRGAYSNDEVAAAISQGGTGISATYIWMLRRGDRDNPTLRHLEALAKFFGVPPAYFLDDELAAKVDEQLSLVVAMKNAGVRSLALRMADLSEQSLAPIAEVIERVRELESRKDHRRGRR